MDIKIAPNRSGERIEVALTYTEGSSEFGAVLYPPHPFLGGDMDNNILLSIAHSIAMSGIPVFRFNYRSVGRSKLVVEDIPKYEYWKEKEVCRDYQAVLDDGQEALSRAYRMFRPCILIGYSFGCFVALQQVLEKNSDFPLAFICPPISRLDFTALREYSAPSLLIFAENDGFDPTPAPQIINEKFPHSRIEIAEGEDHFFVGKEAYLADQILDFLKCSSSQTFEQ